MKSKKGVSNIKRKQFLSSGWILCILMILAGCRQDSESAIAFYLQTDLDWRNATEETAKANNSVIREIQLEADKRHQYTPMVSIAQKADELVKGFNVYLDSLRNDLIKEAGIITTYSEKPSLISVNTTGIRDESAVRRYFESGTPRNDEKLRQKIQDFKNNMANLLDTMSKIIPIDVALIKDTEIAFLKTEIQLGSLVGSLSDKTDQDDMKGFFQEPPYMIFAQLSHLQHNISNAEFKIVNFLMSKIGNGGIVCGGPPMIVSSAESDFVIIGEKFKTDIFLSSDSYTPGEIYSIKVNGKPIPLHEGKGNYQIVARKPGENYYHVDIIAKFEELPKPETFSRTFKYEAGYRCY